VRITALTGALLSAFFLWATPAGGDLPGGDSVVGQGQTQPVGGLDVEVAFDFDATSGPLGEDPGGYARLDILVLGTPTFHVEGPVTCVSVSGNEAVVGFELDPELSTFPAVGAIIEVVDNGVPGAEPPDVFNSGPVDDPGSCIPRLQSPEADVARGDITVTDAPPPPTSKSECRNGGYERFGFKNQGRCIAFVERGAEQ
jgi:hypothetical protein